MKPWKLCLFLISAYAIAQAPQLIPVWNGQAYTFPRLGPTITVTNGQLDALIPAGTQGPPGPVGPQGPPGLTPYLQPNGDLNLGMHNLIANEIIAQRVTAKEVVTGGTFKMYLTAGPAPTDTCDANGCADAVMFFDSSDNRLKMRKRDGSLVLIEMTPPQ